MVDHKKNMPSPPSVQQQKHLKMLLLLLLHILHTATNTKNKSIFNWCLLYHSPIAIRDANGLLISNAISGERVSNTLSWIKLLQKCKGSCNFIVASNLSYYNVMTDKCIPHLLSYDKGEKSCGFKVLFPKTISLLSSWLYCVAECILS